MKGRPVLVILIIFCLPLLNLFLVPTVYAEDQDKEVSEKILPTSFWYNFVKIKEYIQLNLLTFNETSKVKLLEEFEEQRIDEMQYAESIEDFEAMDKVIERYDSQKTAELEYSEAVSDEDIMNQVRENTLEQQQIMTQLQLRLDNQSEVQNNIVQVQKSVAERTGETIGAVLGESSSNEFNEQVRVVWMDPNADEFGNMAPLPDNMAQWEYAPGTSGRNDAGVVVEYTVEGDKGSGETIIVVTEENGSGNGNNDEQKVVIEENVVVD